MRKNGINFLQLNVSGEFTYQNCRITDLKKDSL